MASCFAATATDCISESTENSAEDTWSTGTGIAARIAAIAATAANFNRNLLANYSRYTNSYFIWNTYCNSLANLNGLLFADWNTYGVRNFLANRLASPVAHGIVAGTSFWNHVANSLAYILDSLLANPFAGSVANGSSTALWNHVASFVTNGSLTALWNHFAGGVAYGTATWLANIAANGVAYSLAVALRNHLAGGVAYGTLTALWNHLADSVRNCFSYTASLVTYTVDFLSFAGRNPALLADRSRWALYTFNMASAWAINTSASAFVPYPSAWLADNTTYCRTRYFFCPCFPISTIDGNRLGVIHWRDN